MPRFLQAISDDFVNKGGSLGSPPWETKDVLKQYALGGGGRMGSFATERTGFPVAPHQLKNNGHPLSPWITYGVSWGRLPLKPRGTIYKDGAVFYACSSSLASLLAEPASGA